MLDEDPEFRQEIRETIAANDIEWQKFVALCSNHLILPVIYLKFLKHGILEYLPEELSEYLKDIYELNLSRNKQILIQLQEITAILNKGNIYPVFLKGAAHLLDELYSDTGERILGDIDFLVPEKDYLPSARLLENDGYAFYTPIMLFHVIEKMKHYPALSKQGCPAFLEIHRLLTEKNLRWFNPAITDKDKRTVKMLKGCYVLSDHHKIIHNFVHAQLNHDGHIKGIVSFRDLYDLYLLSKRSALKQTTPEIKCKQKAIAYFVFGAKAFGLGEKFYPESNFSAWLFSKKHDLNLDSPTFYTINRTIIFLSQLIFKRYLGLIFKSLYSKKIRQTVINRLTNRQWYSDHFRSITVYFKRSQNS